MVLWSAFSNEHSVFVHPEPKFSIFSELSCLIDISIAQKKIAKKSEKDFKQISERQDLLRKFFFHSYRSVA